MPSIDADLVIADLANTIANLQVELSKLRALVTTLTQGTEGDVKDGG